MAALLELGAGFHGELTGRENIYLNGVDPRRLTQAEIDRIFDEIVAFAEIEQFIDNQVKHYSSGMYGAARLRHRGERRARDPARRRGARGRRRGVPAQVPRTDPQFQREGRTILLVTHAVDLVRQICDRAAVLDHGELVAVGAPG